MGKITKLLENMGERQISKPSFAFSQTKIEIKLPKIQLGKINPRIAVYHDPEGLIAENFKILRSQILHPRTGLPSRFVLITSAIPGEGKSYITINLAFSFAKSVPTILVETDLRKPSFNKFLGISPSTGLADYFLKGLSLTDVVFETNYPNLYLLPVGENHHSLKDVFSSEKVVNLLEDLRKTFSNSFFLFDSAPLMVASETISLSRLVDGVLFVVRYGYSDRDIISESLEKIGRSKLLGFVFNAYHLSNLGLFSPKLKHVKYMSSNR